MKRTGRKIGILAAFGLGVSLISGCGCGTAKTVDEASEQVMKITIAPEVTPTPAPSEVNSKAVVTNGNLTMVNEYLAGDGTTADGTTGDSGTDGTTDGTEVDSESYDEESQE